MKIIFIFLLFFWSISTENCPSDVEKILKDQIGDIVMKLKKTKSFKLECNYDHNNNPFNMDHKLKGSIKVGKSNLANFNVNINSSLWDVFAYKKLDFDLCG